jgi:hypothetical protein
MGSGVVTALIGAGGTVVGAAIGYLGARRGARTQSEATERARLWEKRVPAYEGVAAWLRARQEDRRKRLDVVSLVASPPSKPPERYAGADDLLTWGSPEVVRLYSLAVLAAERVEDQLSFWFSYVRPKLDDSPDRESARKERNEYLEQVRSEALGTSTYERLLQERTREELGITRPLL